MKYRILTAFTLLFLLVTGCEKSIATDEDGTSGGDTPTAGISDADKQNALTISQAWEVADGTVVCVKGYLVASTQRSIQNAIFSAPFKGTTAIVLAEEPIKGSDYLIDYDDLFPVCLTDASKGIRNNFNLVDHPEYWNHMVYIIGTRADYLSMAGLKKVTAIEVGEAYQAEEPDTPDAPDEPVTPDPEPDPDDPVTPDNPDTPDDPVTPDNPTPTSDVLTVAQAKQEGDLKAITVEGFIVGAIMEITTNEIKYSFDKSTSFENIKAGILLADKKYDSSKKPEEQFDLVNYSDLLPVGLYGCKPSNIIDKLNLKNNPNNQNKRVRLKGTKQQYLIQDALKELTSYEFIE